MKKITNFIMSQEMIENLKTEVSEFKGLDRFTVGFNLMNINRLQSTMICMLKDSYVQQSQRYVKNNISSFEMLNTGNSYLDLKYENLINKTMDLYDRMTEIKEESRGKSRTTVKDYKHGIPIEDARYILPLSAKTNISVTMGGDKFLVFISLLKKYSTTIFKNLFIEVSELLNGMGIEVEQLVVKSDVINDLFASNVNELFNVAESTSVEVDSKGIDAICRGILMSTTSDPSKRVDEKYPTLESRQQLINRVAGYGHTSVLEQYRFNSIMKCSMVTFHQLIRHRMITIKPLDFGNMKLLLSDKSHVVPKSIMKSQFVDEYNNLINEWRQFTTELVQNKCFNESAILTILNGDVIPFNYTTNVRADVEFMNKRLCVNAQWEIRQMAKERLNVIRNTEIGFIYDKFAKADCHLPRGCQEGAYSCMPSVREAAKLAKK